MKIAKGIQKLIESFEKLPGVGPKSAQRLTFYLLHNPQKELDRFAQALSQLKKDTRECSICFNIADTDPCPICSDVTRKSDTLCVVEQPLDTLAIDKGDFYRGKYHVLGGSISPLNNIGPEELRVFELLNRLSDGTIKEVILATNPNMEGEATAMYIKKLITDRKIKVNITRIGRGLPIGSDLEYADSATLNRAFEGRKEF